MAHDDNGDPRLEEPGRAARVSDVDDVGTLADVEVRAGVGGMDGARDDGALQAERLGAERVPMGEGLVDRVEVVERAAQALDEQEDERDDQQGEDGQDPPAGPPARAADGTAGPWCTSDVGGLGGGVGSVVVPVTTARRGAARSPARPAAAPTSAAPAPSAGGARPV